MTKLHYIIITVLVVTAFAAGRFLTPEKVKVETRTVTVEVIKKEENTQVDTHVVEVTKPDGTKIVETTTQTNTQITTIKDKDKTTEASKTVSSNTQTLAVNVLAGLDVTNPSNGFVYGAHVSKQLLGPISFGLFGLTNKTAGISVGLRF